MKIIVLIALILSISFAVDNKGQKGVQNYDVELKFSNEPQWNTIGELQVDQNIQYKQAFVKLNRNQESIIQWDSIEIQQNPFALLRFTDKENSENNFLTHIDLQQQQKILSGLKRRRKSLQNQEIIELVTNIDERIISINYTVKQVKKKEDNSIKADFVESSEATEVHFVPGQGQKAAAGGQPGASDASAPGQPGQQGQEQQQPAGIMGFVKKYFWYIVIGLGVFMMLSNVDPEAAQQQAQGAQRQQAQRRR